MKIKNFIPKILHEPLLILIDWWYRLQYGFTRPIVITDIYGVQSVLYPYTTMHIRWLLKRGMYTKEMRAMEKLLKPTSKVFDIGANVGIVSALIAKRFVPNGIIYAFEPFPDTYKKLCHTLALNNLDNVRSYNIAISDTDGIHDFFYEEDASSELNSLGNVSTGDPTHTLTKSIPVPTCTLDSFCAEKEISTIDFVKIDVEGFEYETLCGMKGMLLSGKIGTIQFEISQTPLESLGKTSKPIFDLLKEYGYHCYDFDENTDSFCGPIEYSIRRYDNYYASKTDITLIT